MVKDELRIVHEREEKLVRALQAIVAHQEIVSKSLTSYSTTSIIAKRALQEHALAVEKLEIESEDE